jgi:O-antigen ligase
MTIIATRGRLGARLDLRAVAAWGMAFSLVVALALQDGGYDTVPRGQVGIIVWWIVLLGVIAGRTAPRIEPPALVAIALLAAFAAWTGASIGHSESAERATTELSRVATYVGVLVIALSVTARTAPRHAVNGIACAAALVTALAVLSRLQPQWFPHNAHVDFLPAAVGELSYPLNYWNLLAGFSALGFPLLLGIAVDGRTPASRAAAAAMLPVTALCLYLTSSRGGVVALGVGLVVMLALAPRRGAILATLAGAGAGAVVLVAFVAGHHALRSGALTPEALSQGDQVSVAVVAVVLGVGLGHVALDLARRHVRLPRVPARATRALMVGALVAALLAVGAGAAGGLGERARELARIPAPAVTGDDSAGNSRAPLDIRYRFWGASLDAVRARPLRGIGAGSFEFWWARNGTEEGQFRDAHSLYFENLAELGIIGFALIGGFVLWILGASVARTRRSAPESRTWMAAATGGLVVFSVTAGLEWAWEMAVLPVTAMLLAAVTLAGPADGPDARRAVGLRLRLGAAAVAIAALVVIAVPLASAVAVQDSRAAARAGRLNEAIADALTAERLQPDAATPKLQRALVLERLGRLDAAAIAARAAAAHEPTNWRPWLVRARIAAERGRAREAVRDLKRARALNPRFTPFAHS